MPFKKRPLISKLWLKYTDRDTYKTYKWELGNYKQSQFTNFLLGSQRLNNLSKITGAAKNKGHLNVIHSGNAGDIMYALPTLKKIHEQTGVPVNLYLGLNKPMLLQHNTTHPLGNVMFNQKMADMITPLIRQQAYINICQPYTDEVIDIDLDYFRAGLIPLDKGNIARWCGYITGVTPDLWQNWLSVKPDTDYADTIVIARSARYQNKQIDYSFISQYQNVVFIGVETEYSEIKKMIPNIRWEPVNDFLQMACIIAGCKFFIGNQSFPFSIAEGLKVPRVLELSFDVINVVPEGPGGNDFLFQQHFESLVAALYHAER
ncbi:hypothetical protein [Mucilaginibacter phyllosphaerae]|uniref:ADP-heptose--LPS heptosyltransferase n=1 Tax=Mucilaginibacter phyllosphaerae TaxID=1812349 RepID=A0A4Y8AF07_9SPHI|nr:hypothetical protein [Mucilaginibacter phyllosphaerae]MBB3969033.1 hypothetical protein [Mucilaginibacter phyllosphaerae]TEW67354.1 hypothetical protein E2R65_05015 [Mucilaginibacter phyllosphaerae]GGH23668.1 hypothetical protein GCM10007352_37670 [Mucilaginibacter phyllosphaerae]